MQIDNYCFLCGGAGEDGGHLFFKCTGLSLSPIAIGNISKSFALIELFLKTAWMLKKINN
jgi:hypothetical protein